MATACMHSKAFEQASKQVLCTYHTSYHISPDAFIYLLDTYTTFRSPFGRCTQISAMWVSNITHNNYWKLAEVIIMMRREIKINPTPLQTPRKKKPWTTHNPMKSLKMWGFKSIQILKKHSIYAYFLEKERSGNEYGCVCVCVSVCTHAHVFACVCVCVCMCTYERTNTSIIWIEYAVNDMNRH